MPVSAIFSNITLAILAGGEGSRMGRPKAHLTINNQPILQYLLERFNWPGPTLLITAPGREHPPAASLFSKEAIDPVANQGPLRGVLTALENTACDITLITTVDMPAIDSTHLRWLAAQLQDDPSAAAIMLTRTISQKNEIEPFPSAFRQSAIPILRRRLAAEHRSLQSLQTEKQIRLLPAHPTWPSTIWTNLNYPQDYNQFLASQSVRPL